MEQKSQFKLCNGMDLLRAIDKNSIDLILTDPPYVISRESGMQKMVDNNETCEKYGTKYAITTNYGDWDNNFTIETLTNFIKEFKRVLKSGGTGIIFFDIWKIETLKNILETEGFSKIRFIEWIKTNPVPINTKATYLSNAREVALSFIKGGKSTFNSNYDKGIYEYPIYQGKKGIDRIHPTQKSLPLFRELIRKHSNENDLILDPFGGSGTTYIASLLENRRCLSCEVNEEYYHKTINRVKHYHTLY